MKAVIHTDGACLGNPGPMGLGIYIVFDDDSVIKKSIPFGHGTNNVAEYSALLKALKLAKEHGATHIEAFLDSKLVVEQVSGNWHIKDSRLQEIASQVLTLIQSFDSCNLQHIPREKNAIADELSKQAAYQV